MSNNRYLDFRDRAGRKPRAPIREERGDSSPPPGEDLICWVEDGGLPCMRPAVAVFKLETGDHEEIGACATHRARLEGQAGWRRVAQFDPQVWPDGRRKAVKENYK